MKKIVLALFALVFVFALAACNQGTKAEPKNSSGEHVNSNHSAGAQTDADTKKPIEIQYWYAWGDKIGENNENLVQQFNESQDEVIVQAHYQGSYADLHAKTQAAFAAKNAPEVTQNEIASIGIFAKSGMTEDLTPFVERDNVEMDDFVQGLMGNSYVDGKLYGLPYLRSTPILYLNATMAKEAGLDPAGPKNWAEFEEYARKLAIPGERVGITMPINIWFFEAFVAQSEGRMISEDGTKATFNSGAGVETLKLWLKMKEEGTLKIPTGDDAGTVTRQDFLNQKTGMMFSSTADLTLLLQIAEEGGFELNTTFMPANLTYGVPTGGANLVMTAGLSEEKQEAAWKFIKWMTEKEQTIYASSYTGYLPSRYSAIESEQMKQLYEEKPQFKVAVDQLEYGRPRPMEAVYPEISKILQDQISRAIIDTFISPEDALNEAAKRADELLSK